MNINKLVCAALISVGLVTTFVKAAEPDKRTTVEYIQKAINSVDFTSYYIIHERQNIDTQIPKAWRRNYSTGNYWTYVSKPLLRISGNGAKLATLVAGDRIASNKAYGSFLAKVEREVNLFEFNFNDLSPVVKIKNNRLTLNCVTGKCIKKKSRIILDASVDNSRSLDINVKGEYGSALFKNSVQSKRDVSMYGKYWFGHWRVSSSLDYLSASEYSKFARAEITAVDKVTLVLDLDQAKTTNLSNAISHLIKLSGGEKDPFAAMGSKRSDSSNKEKDANKKTANISPKVVKFLKTNINGYGTKIIDFTNAQQVQEYADRAELFCRNAMGTTIAVDDNLTYKNGVDGRVLKNRYSVSFNDGSYGVTEYGKAIVGKANATLSGDAHTIWSDNNWSPNAPLTLGYDHTKNQFVLTGVQGVMLYEDGSLPDCCSDFSLSVLPSTYNLTQARKSKPCSLFH